MTIITTNTAPWTPHGAFLHPNHRGNLFTGGDQNSASPRKNQMHHYPKIGQPLSATATILSAINIQSTEPLSRDDHEANTVPYPKYNKIYLTDR